MSAENERDFSIDDIEEGSPTETDSIQLPLNFIVNGEVGNDDVKVYIHQSVYKSIEHYSHSDLTRELGSILLGGYSEYSNKVHVVISDYIEAKYADASASTLTFTHETWDYVHKERERLHPDSKIIGWQHTHPGYGIFLSNNDMFIQENFFNLPFQVAYVVDPKQNIRGFFQWKNGKVEKLKGYYIYDEVGKKISVETEAAKQTVELAKASGKFSPIMLSLLLAVALMSLVFFAVLKANLSAQNDRLKALQDELANAPVNSDNIDQVEKLMQKVESQQSRIDEQEKTIAEIRELLASTGDTDSGGEDVILFTDYTVERGNTLAAICAKHNIDYGENIDIIKAVNGIDDPNAIYAGQKILLPIKR